MADDNDTFEIAGLDRVIRALKVKIPVARVGILGANATAARSDGMTNSEIGAAHEFGTSKVPQRSFLRMPIGEKFNDELQKSGQMDDDVLKEVVKTGTLTSWMRKIAKIGEAVVLDAFATGGFGKWVSWSPNYRGSKTGNILVDTTQLRNSITSDVK